MSYNTVIEQGSFLGTGSAVTLQIRSGVDWIEVYNYTAAAQAAADLGVEFYWQDGMPQGGGLVTILQGTQANNPLTEEVMADNTGFFIIDTSAQNLGSQVAVTAVTNATKPVVSTGNTGALVPGSVVRLYGLTAGKANLNGYDFAIDAVTPATSFRIASVLEQAPGATAATGFYRQVNFNPSFYPSFRYIVNITSVNSTTTYVTVSVPSLYQIGQSVTFIIPNSAYGMIELNQVTGTVTGVNDTLAAVGGVPASSITVNIDTTSFTPFVFPLAVTAAATPIGKAMVIPNGEDTAYALAQSQNILSDATIDEGFIGVMLAAGDNSPAGNEDDIIFWKAGHSFSNVITG